jgi:hypothetical protein
MVVSPMISTLGSSKAIRIVMLSSRNQIAERAGSEKWGCNLTSDNSEFFSKIFFPNKM